MPAQDVLVIGLGYVCLPPAVQAARAGFRVTGYDTSAEIAASLNAGRSHVDDVSGEEVEATRARGFRAAADEAGIGPQDVIVICVPTPLSEADGPDLGAVRAAAEAAGRLLRPGCWCRWSRLRTRAPLMRWSGRCWRRRPGRTLGYPFRFVELAQEINGRMPGYVTERAAELLNRITKPVNGARVLLLGVTDKKDIADQRESPARPIARKLRARGAAVAYHDPYVPAWQVGGQDVPRVSDLQAAVAAADLVIVLQAHRDYDLTRIAAGARLLLDTRGVVPAAPRVEAL